MGYILKYFPRIFAIFKSVKIMSSMRQTNFQWEIISVGLGLGKIIFSVLNVLEEILSKSFFLDIPSFKSLFGYQPGPVHVGICES